MSDKPARVRLWIALPLALFNPVVACLYCGRARLAGWVLAAVVVSTAVLWFGPLAPPAALYATLAVGLVLGLMPSAALLVWILWRVRRTPFALRWPWPALVAAFIVTMAANPGLWWESPIGHFTIPSGSMVPGIAVGDRIVTENLVRPSARMPAPGDIIVFDLPRDPEQQWVKRMVAGPGDRVQMRGGVPFVNGVAATRQPAEAMPETVALSGIEGGHRAVEETLPNGRSYVVLETAFSPVADTQEFLVPEGHVFVLGDNRGNAMDSRMQDAVGYIPLENIIGRAVLRYRLGEGRGAWPIGSRG